MTSATTSGLEGERGQETRPNETRLTQRELKLDLEQQLIVAQTEKVMAETRLMEIRARWRPLLVGTYAMWAVALIAWAVVLIGFAD